MPETEPATARREALIVATDAYEDPKLRALRAPARDAEELARVLGDPEIGDFHVGVSFNEPDHAVRRKISEFFRDRGRDDLLLLHMSCHGLKDEDGTLYFASANTAVELLEATAIPSEFVNRQMTKSRSRRIVLLLDCCFGGAFARGMVHRAGESVAIKEEFDGQGRVVLTASRAMEYAFEGDQLEGEARPSVFTSAIVEGLETGVADRDHDSRISVDELYDYVFDRVREATPNQTPSKWTFDVQGDLYVARSKFREVEPAELPFELRAAIESPFANVRAGAVEELARLFGGPDVRLSAAAQIALGRLADDDSRRVSEASTVALGETAGAEPAPVVSVPGPPARESPPAVAAATLPPAAAGRRLAAALAAASRWQAGLALLGAACIVLGYFRSASWERTWVFARGLEEEIWLIWSPPEAFAAAFLVVAAVLASRRGKLRREAADGVLLCVGVVVVAAMAAFVGTWFNFAGTSKWTGFGALTIGVAGIIGMLSHRASDVPLPPRSLGLTGAGIALGLAPLVMNVVSWDDSTLLGYAGGALYAELLVAWAAAILAFLGLVRFPRARLHAAGVLAAVGVLTAVHVIGILVEISAEVGVAQIRWGGPLGVLGGVLLVLAAARIVRAHVPEQALATPHAQPT